MAITNVGYDGSVSAVEFAQLEQHAGAIVPVVCGRNDFAVTANPGGTLTCNVAAGSAAAPGVLTTSDATAAVSFDSVVSSGQTRWDAVVLRRNWSTNTSSLVVVKGTAAAAAPMVLPSGVDLVLNSGVDQVLALVQITYGLTVPTAVVDRRLQASKVFAAPSTAALPTASLALYGMEAVVGEARYRCELVAGSPAWVSGTAAVEVFGSATGFPAAATGATTQTVVIDRISVPVSPTARTAQMVTNVYVLAAGATAQVNLALVAGSTGIGYARRALDVSEPDFLMASGNFLIPANTAVTFEARMSRFSGTGSFTTSINSKLTNTNLIAVRN